MLAEVTEPGERRRFSRMVEQEIARMEQLLAGVREITLIDSHLQHERQENEAVDTLLEKIVEGFRLREGARVAFELHITGQPSVVESSEDRLIQVSENILDNAVSFSPMGGVIRIDLFREGGSVVARISDQGPGILDDNLGRIFERFFTYRSDSVRRKTGHTGLGLAIVKSIVEGYGGSVTGANGAGVGRCSRFDCLLRMSQWCRQRRSVHPNETGDPPLCHPERRARDLGGGPSPRI